MFIVLLPQGVNSTIDTKYFNILTYSLCVNVYCVNAAVCQLKTIIKLINSLTYTLYLNVYSVPGAGCQPNYS